MKESEKLRLPANRDTVLDFGCGLGRLSRALASHFLICYGIDICQRMVEKAKVLNGGLENCRLELHCGDELFYEVNFFDFVVCKAVLQHLPDRGKIGFYLKEFIRVLKPGGLAVVQLPSRLPFHRKIQLSRRLYRALRCLGLTPDFLYYRLQLVPILMNSFPERRVVQLIEESGGRILRIWREYGFSDDRTYFITKKQ